MKKTLAAAITSALVIGVASTTFAAANPFSDVPTNHWSFDAVAKLAQSGIIEGYGDNTFRGDSKITRYEMAQMVAKAMAKDGLSTADKATVDRLGVEYADELNNLGVRVANLEKKSDNVQFAGLLRLDGTRTDTDGEGTEDSGLVRLRLNIKAKVNENWNVIGRIEADHNMGTGESGKVSGQYAYAEGPLLGSKARLGRFGGFDMKDLTNGGMLIDTKLTGAEFAFGGDVKTTLTYGRLGNSVYKLKPGSTSDYASIQFDYKPTDRLKLAAAYYNIDVKDIKYFEGKTEDNNGIWQLGFDYAFNPDFTLGAIYAASNVNGDRTFDVANNGSDQEDSYTVQMTYKGAKSNVVGSYGAWLAYRQLGKLAAFAPTYDGVGYNQRGYEIGVNYMIDKNILTKLVYFDGEFIDSKVDTNKLFGRVEFQF